MMASTSPAVQRQLAKLARMLENPQQPAPATSETKAAAADKNIAVILKHVAAAPATAPAASTTAPAPCEEELSKACSCCATKTDRVERLGEKLDKMSKEVARVHELLVDLSAAIAPAARPAAEAESCNVPEFERVARAEAVVAASAAQPPLAPPVISAPAPSVPEPAFIVTESSSSSTTLAAQQTLPTTQVISAVQTQTFEEAARPVAEGDVETLRTMLREVWRERTKALYSPERLAEEPTEPPSAMDVFRDKTAELANGTEYGADVRSKQEFLERLRLVLKQTAPGILATLPENPHARQIMTDLWGPEWVS